MNDNILDKGWIYWKEQCLYCQNNGKTDVCERNKSFIRLLDSMWHNYIGTVNFKCDYFQSSEEDYNKLSNIFKDYGKDTECL